MRQLGLTLRKNASNCCRVSSRFFQLKGDYCKEQCANCFSCHSVLANLTASFWLRLFEEDLSWDGHLVLITEIHEESEVFGVFANRSALT